MATTYNTGVTGSASNIPKATAFTFTVPAGVLTGDVMIVSLNVFSFTANTFGMSTPSSGGGVWSQIGTTQVGSQGSIGGWGSAWYRVATASDPGSTFTVSWTGTNGSNQFWWASDLEAYTGAWTGSGGPIGNFSANVTNASTVIPPTITTNRAGSWGIQCCPVSVSGSGSISAAPATSRHILNPGAGVDNAISDTNGSAGAAGSNIGGGTFTLSASSSGAGIGFTIELYTQGPPSVVIGVTPPQIPHPLWFELLEVAYSRADWQVQGVATLAPFSWRLFDGVNGRPGTSSTGTQPPASATANAAPVTLGTSFYTTQGGMWFQGYWWYVAASGGQPTGPQQFALWSANLNITPNGQVVPGSVVTSGTLSTGWNYVPLPQPVALGIWSMYTAATGTTGPYPQTANQTNSGGPYSAGWSNGPVTTYSDQNGSNPPIYGVPSGNGSISVAGSNPAVAQPLGDANAGDLFWIDVQVTNVPPAGYQGSFRLWPNMYDADPSTSADSSVNYVIGTEIILAQPCRLAAVWYYVPGGQGSSGNQWATSADVWNVRTGQRVATNPAPVWLNGWTNQVDGQSNSGRWVYCQMAGPPVLPAGDYYVTVYNSNGSPNGWGSKRFGYWEKQPLGGAAPNYAPGVNGITCGPLYAPPTPLASTVYNYNGNAGGSPAWSDGTLLTGQSVFAAGPPNQVPYLYVGTQQQGSSSPTTSAFQTYWVDAEVIPVTSLPASPDLPQRIPTPLIWDLIEVAAYRAEGKTPPAAYSQQLPASLVVSGSLGRGIGRLLAAALVVTSALGRGIARALAASLVAVAAIVRSPGKALAASLAAAGSLSRGIGRSLASAAVLAGSLGRGTGKNMPAGIIVTAAETRSVGKLLAAGAVVTGAVTRGIGRALPGSLTLAGAGAFLKVKLLTLAASLALNGTLTRNIGRTLAASAVATGSLVRNPAKILTAGAVVTGSLTRGIGKGFSAALSLAGALLTGSAHFLNLPASLTLTGSLTAIKVKLLTLTASLAVNGSLSRNVGKGLAASASLAGSVRRQCGKGLSAGLSAGATLGRGIARTFRAVLTAIGSGSFGRGGTNYPLTFSAGVGLSAAWSSVVNRLLRLYSVTAARRQWAVTTARRLWSVTRGRNGTQ